MTDPTHKNLVVICGPTASGKTKLAVSLAIKLNAEIISADSRQVYRGMDIGTGKDLREYDTPAGAINHHLIDIVEPHEVYTLFRYQQDCYTALEQVRARNKLPIMVGGTGLYIEAVVKQYQIPDVAEDPELRKGLAGQELAALKQLLKQRDPQLYSQTDLSSKKRIIRALEVTRHTPEGTPSCGRTDPPGIHSLVLGTLWERNELQQRINQRLEQRLQQGLLAEVADLLHRNLSPERYSYFGMEYKYVALYLQGQLPYQEMVQKLRTAIHQLAKRQETYFRGMVRRGIPIHWIPRADVSRALDVVKKFTFF